MTILTRQDLDDASYPTTVQLSLASGAQFARYDPSGRFIAAGGYTTQVLIWELATKAILTTLNGHNRQVTSVDWSVRSRFILTSSRDWNVVVWDLASLIRPLQRYKTIRFDAPVVSASFHPKNSKMVAALLSSGEAFLIDTRGSNHPFRTEIWEKVEDPHPITAIRFHPKGVLLFASTSNGHILSFNVRTKMMIARHRVQGVHTIKSIEVSMSGLHLLTNSTDRIIRQFIIPTYPSSQAEEDAYVEHELDPILRLLDPVNRVSWSSIGISASGRWIAGGVSGGAGHKICIWDATNGRYTTTLDGGGVSLTHLQWHPRAPELVSTTRDGNVLVWQNRPQENFAAYAGGFEEIPENVLYEEREDEFDIEDEDSIARRKDQEEETEVDIEQLDEMDSLNIDTEMPNEDLQWALEENGLDLMSWEPRSDLFSDE